MPSSPPPVRTFAVRRPAVPTTGGRGPAAPQATAPQATASAVAARAAARAARVAGRTAAAVPAAPDPVTPGPAAPAPDALAAGRPVPAPEPRPDGTAPAGRERELAALAALLARPTEQGVCVLVQGEAGSGKSALLREVLRRAQADGADVVAAWADPSESGAEFGVVRQLFGHLVRGGADDGAAEVLDGPAAPALRVLAPALAPDHPVETPADMSGPAPGATPAPDGGGGGAAAVPDAAQAAATTGLHRLVVELAARSARLVLVVDDLQWADRASMLWLRCLLRRTAELPVVVIATVSPGEPSREAQTLAGVLPLFRHRLALTPLDRAAVTSVVAEVLGEAGEEAFTEACQVATGGNLFLLRALLRSVRSAALPPDARTAARLTHLVPAEVGRALQELIRTAGPDAVAVARAVAVLGEVSAHAPAVLGEPSEQAAAVPGEDAAHAPTVDLIAAVTGLAETAVQDALHTLARAGLTVRSERTAAFVCPVIGVAVADEVLPSVRRDLHGRAAHLMLTQDLPPARVAAHAQLAPPGLPWVPGLLRRAAADAARRGRPQDAVGWLRRALREPLDDDARASLLIALGEAELASDLPEAADHLRRSLDLSEDPVERTAAARRLAGALFALDRYPEGIAVLGRTAAALRAVDPGQALRLEVDHVYAGLHGLDSAPAVLARLAGLRAHDATGTAAERPLAALLALRRILVEGDSPQEAAVLARQALADGMNPADDESFVYAGAVLFLGATGETELALRHADEAVTRAGAPGSAFALAHSVVVRACVQGQLGRVLDCEADARAALRTLREIGVDERHSHGALAVSTLLDSLLKQGRVAEAEALLERAGLGGDLTGHWINDYLQLARGQLRVAQGRPAEALADFRGCGGRIAARGIECTWIYPWRSEAALVHAALGERPQAVRLAEEELAIARRWGSPETVGAALRALALATGGPDGLDLLREAVGLLARSPSRYRHAQALGDLGAALRRAGRVPEAREHLQQAASAAHATGASAVAERALEELRACGDRPRSRTFHGVAALTPTEQRVAGLAAEGMTNREIAQHLFVGLRTVEVHLTNTYGKLGIDGRPGLAAALTPPVGA
ncbi:LuxR family transcriptional regulator [Kitasatospora sp. NBC_00240]|uniref:LuxR family transcriptional regulator n=1 Tax=Kitasatospora sp. NBC_00240 TaxID=2903567 RepID=UPI00225ACB8D|nr:LuxR family transcriptional regulator [Kitasatospora sp. NBC_00240]MCX5208890.1 LuxR family transcriptional regulator [Kitasatospora sp. NBC_00240]